MRVFLAGASGVIGRRMVPLMLAQGHEVTAMARDPRSIPGLESAGARGIVCDVFDADGLAVAVATANPDVVVNQVTDLPDARAVLPFKVRGLNRARRHGTDNLLRASRTAGVPRVIAQSTAFPLPSIAQHAVDYLEERVLNSGGVVVRYGLFYGPDTWYAAAPKGDKIVHIDEAARRTVELLDAPSGIVEVLDAATA